MSKSMIGCDVDFAAQGKQNGYLRLPHSVHRSAYGRILIPVVMIANGEGPTVLLMAGNHGDEYEAQIALGNLCRSLETEDIRGRLIILPMANFPAADAGLRTSPVDGGNLNRAFPGNPAGTPTEMIAHYIEEELLPRCDYCIDLHSGGSSLYYPPTFLRGLGHSDAEGDMLSALQSAFDAPYSWVFTSGGGRSSAARTAMGAANRKGAITVMAELGGGGTVSPDILALTERGLLRMLHCVGMLPGYSPGPANGTRELTVVESVLAYTRGIFEPCVDVGAEVETGDRAAIIHFPHDPWKTPETLYFQNPGMVMCKRVPGRVERGDCLFHVGQDLPRQSGKDPD
jgi:predicted deacylase